MSVMLPHLVTIIVHEVANSRPRALRAGIASAILVALAAACSGGGTTTPKSEHAAVSTVTSSSAPALTPAADPVSSVDLPGKGESVNESEPFEGYTLYTPKASRFVYLIDNHGRVIHELAADAQLRWVKLLDNGNLLANNNREVDRVGSVVWEYPHLHQHHDLLKMPNGNVLFQSRLIIPREEAIALGANPDNLLCPSLRATHIVEVRPIGPDDGEVVWEWSALDHLIQDFDPEKPNYGIVADRPELLDINFAHPAACASEGREADWVHANALDYNAQLDQVMITAKHFSEIWIIDHSTSIEEAAGRTGGNSGKGGDLLYRWGNPRAYRRGTVDDQRLFWPHNGQWIPEGLPGAGNVLVFNNGNEYPGFERGYSSVDEFAPPADGYRYRLDEGSAYGPNEVVWRYAADPPQAFYADRASGAQRLPNGATLITDGPANRIFEVTREGKTVWEFEPPQVGSLHRAYRYAPDHPGLRSLLGPGVIKGQ